ncbi:hypothetical protein AB6A40_004987 [Gnathostoma spinigerum]|uniref:Copper transport protein n=1 Tax=Gnathostoma spinigerum TaxID=75299 RepID=A0ABD6EE55_9BILA
MRPMMMMYFHFRIEEILLFKNWLPESVPVFIATNVAIVLLAISFHLIQLTRFTSESSRLIFNSKKRSGRNGVSESTDLATEHSQCQCPVQQSNARQSSNQLWSLDHIISTALFFIESFLALSLMMIAMTYNVAYFGSLLLGHATGYFFFGCLSEKFDLNDGSFCCC